VAPIRSGLFFLQVVHPVSGDSIWLGLWPAVPRRFRSRAALPAAAGSNYHFAGIIYRVALNIKDPEVDRLAAELATRLHTNKTDAIRHALHAQLALLESRAGDRQAQLLDVMRTEIWPLLSDRSPITKREREEILGYDPETGV
jgi:antitoxin VapB